MLVRVVDASPLAATAAVGGTGGTKRAAPAVLDFSLPDGYSLQLDWHL